MSYLIGVGIGIVGVLGVQWVFSVALRVSLARQELAMYRAENEYLQKEEDEMVDKDLLDLCDLIAKPNVTTGEELESLENKADQQF